MQTPSREGMEINGLDTKCSSLADLISAMSADLPAPIALLRNDSANSLDLRLQSPRHELHLAPAMNLLLLLPLPVHPHNNRH